LGGRSTAINLSELPRGGGKSKRERKRAGEREWGGIRERGGKDTSISLNMRELFPLQRTLGKGRKKLRLQKGGWAKKGMERKGA